MCSSHLSRNSSWIIIKLTYLKTDSWGDDDDDDDTEHHNRLRSVAYVRKELSVVNMSENTRKINLNSFWCLRCRQKVFVCHVETWRLVTASCSWQQRIRSDSLCCGKEHTNPLVVDAIVNKTELYKSIVAKLITCHCEEPQIRVYILFGIIMFQPKFIYLSVVNCVYKVLLV
jgi:hypothetical protein